MSTIKFSSKWLPKPGVVGGRAPGGRAEGLRDKWSRKSSTPGPLALVGTAGTGLWMFGRLSDCRVVIDFTEIGEATEPDEPRPPIKPGV